MIGKVNSWLLYASHKQTMHLATAVFDTKDKSPSPFKGI